MAISGSFVQKSLAQVRELQPTTPPAPPNERHSTRTEPDSAWNPQPASVGSGLPAEYQDDVNLGIVSKGITREIGNFRSHDTDNRNHGSKTAQYIWPQAYSPYNETPSTTYHTVDDSQQEGAPISSARSLARSRNSFSTPVVDSNENLQVQGAKNGDGGRVFVSHYSSLTTLGAMYSKNTLRGIVPQEAAVPVATPGLDGIRGSGIPGNSPMRAKLFATPQLNRTPPSMSETIMAEAPATPEYYDVGTW